MGLVKLLLQEQSDAICLKEGKSDEFDLMPTRCEYPPPMQACMRIPKASILPGPHYRCYTYYYVHKLHTRVSAVQYSHQYPPSQIPNEFNGMPT